MRIARHLKCGAAAVALLVAACTTAQVATFESKAAPVVVGACSTLHSVESNPLLQGGINIGLAAASSGATGGVAGTAVEIVKGMGDAYCLNGPPAGDTTSPAQQAAWLLNQIIPVLSAPVPAK